MKSCGLIPIAAKEFTDHLCSKNFLLIAGILVLICTVGLIGGLDDYREDLDEYNERLSVAGSEEGPGFMSERPSILSIFVSIGAQMSVLGAILGIALGFDLITKEKESKSLKQLLSHPIYRDEVINGKALGSAAALLLPLGAVLAVAFAALLIFGIVPDLTEFSLILVFGAVTALMILTYFSVALLMSTVAKNSGTALIYSLIVFVAFTMLVPVATNDAVMETVIGEPPELPTSAYLPDIQSTGDEKMEVAVRAIDTESVEWQEFREARREYEERRGAVNDVLSLLSPSLNYEAILGIFGRVSASMTVTTVMQNGGGSVLIGDAGSVDPASGVAGVGMNVLALIAFPAVFFGLAYSRFMRLDIR